MPIFSATHQHRARAPAPRCYFTFRAARLMCGFVQIMRTKNNRRQKSTRGFIFVIGSGNFSSTYQRRPDDTQFCGCLPFRQRINAALGHPHCGATSHFAFSRLMCGFVQMLPNKNNSRQKATRGFNFVIGSGNFSSTYQSRPADTQFCGCLPFRQRINAARNTALRCYFTFRAFALNVRLRSNPAKQKITAAQRVAVIYGCGGRI